MDFSLLNSALGAERLLARRPTILLKEQWMQIHVLKDLMFTMIMRL